MKTASAQGRHDGSSVVIFAEGPVCRAVCAADAIPRERVENQLSHGEPRGSVLRWRVLDETVRGVANPCACPHHSSRRHWLLVRELRR